LLLLCRILEELQIKIYRRKVLHVTIEEMLQNMQQAASRQTQLQPKKQTKQSSEKQI